jgi:YVTN family beta-propeller protein
MRLGCASLSLKAALLSATLLAGAAGTAWADVDDGVADNDGQLPLPSGQYITPTAATGSTFQILNPNLAQYPLFRPDGAIATALSPNGKTLLVMTSGYNTLNDAQGNLAATGSAEYIFVFDVTNPRAPVQKQVLRPANTFAGLVWAPSGTTFYASGGNDDQVYVYAEDATGGFAQSALIPLGHGTTGIGLQQYPQTGGLAVSQDGSLLVVANTLNESVSVVSTATNKVLFEYDLRPYNTSGANGVAGGEYIYGVAIKGNSTIYATSVRDREVDVVDISTGTPKLTARVAVPGNPVNMVLDKTQGTLYVAQDNSDQVAVINTATNAVTEEIDAIAPPGLLLDTANRYTGAATNNVALSPDGKTLYATNGGANSLAIIPLSGTGQGDAVAGLVPTGWYPTSVSVSADGGTLWVVNNKSDPGANPNYGTSSTGHLTQTKYPGGNSAQQDAFYASNQYIFLLEQSGLLTAPVPAATDLASLTRQVAANNGYNVAPNPEDAAVMSVLHGQIKHVIYLVKENRTFDQVLGDLGNGSNGDPNLTVFGRRITPNFHRLSTQFVTLDNFFDSGEVSGNGWPWTTGGRETDWNEKNISMDYAFDVTRYNAPYDAEGQNSNVSVGYPTVAAREAEQPSYAAVTAGLPGGTANVLPGTNDVGAPDGRNGAKQGGHIWDAALAAGLTVRNYGFFSDNSRYGSFPGAVPELENPAATGVQVQFPTSPVLIANFDPYFRGFDNAFPDAWRYEEFAREFAQFDANNSMPNLVMLRYMHDHMGNFGSAIEGVNTPETQQADNDYAVGRTMQLIAQSKNYAQNTLFVVIEDDAQDGPDHMDAHRSTAYFVGPYVKRGAVVSTRYSTVNVLRTIEDVLGLPHLNLNTAYQRPMTDVFNVAQGPAWTYTAVASTILGTTQLILSDLRDGKVQWAEGPQVKPAHDAAYWARATRGFDWSSEDRVPADLYNRVLWEGLKGDAPYPAERDGRDLRTARPDAGATQD